MKKLFLPLVLSLLCLAFVFTPTTYAATNSTLSKSASVHPHVAGGGCTNYSGSSVTVGACSNINWPIANADAYITIPASIASMSDCEVFIYLYDSSGNRQNWQNWGCKSGYNYYGPVGISSFTGAFYGHATVSWTTNFTTGAQTTVGGDSPVVAF